MTCRRSLLFAVLVAASTRTASAQCSSDTDCKAGRSCVAGACQAIDHCTKDTDCSGDQVCDRETCVAVSPPVEPTAPAGEPTGFPRRAVDQPIALPDGTRYIAAELQLFADDSGPREITFGDWVQLGLHGIYGYRGWQLEGWVDLVLGYSRSDDVPVLGRAQLELDRALDDRVLVGAGLFTFYPTADYASVGAYTGLLWRRKIGEHTAIGFIGGVQYVAADESVGSVYGAAKLTRQLTDGLALGVRGDLDLPLTGDAEARPMATLDVEHWTAGLLCLYMRLFASEHRGAITLGVGHVL